MPHQDALEQYETTEGRDLIRLFAAARPPHEIRAPANFRAKVLQQLEQRRAHRGLGSWLTTIALPMWAPALAAAVLLLSLGLNLWLGLQTWAPKAGGRRQMAQADVSFDAYVFQTGLREPAALGRLVARRATLDDQAVTFGFAPPRAARPYVVGLLYIEALAALQGHDADLATSRLEALEDALTQEAAPPSLLAYVSALRRAVAARRGPDGLSAAVLAPFASLYVDHARDQGQAHLLLFRFGTWLGNLWLAAAAEDQAALRQANLSRSFAAAMRPLHMPKGVFGALDRLDQLLRQSALSRRDMREVRHLIQKTQRLVMPLTG